MDEKTRKGSPGARTLLLGALYGGFAALILYFLFWSLTDSHAYILHSLILGGMVFLFSVLVARYAQNRGGSQRSRGETMKAGGERKPTSEMRWENRPE